MRAQSSTGCNRVVRGPATLGPACQKTGDSDAQKTHRLGSRNACLGALANWRGKSNSFVSRPPNEFPNAWRNG